MRRVLEKELKEIGEGRSLLEKRKENNLKKKERREAYAECNLVQLRHQLEPSASNAQRVRDVISLMEEYGGFA